MNAFGTYKLPISFNSGDCVFYFNMFILICLFEYVCFNMFVTEHFNIHKLMISFVQHVVTM